MLGLGSATGASAGAGCGDFVPCARRPVCPLVRPGLVVGALAARWLSPLIGGDGILYAIPVFGLCAAAGVLVGDALTGPHRGAVRTAGLTPRRVRDYVPPRMTRLLLGLAAVLFVVLTVAAAVASPDDLGRAGRALTLTCRGATESAGPWPGLHCGLPMLASLAVSTAACGWSLRRIATRPGDEQSRCDRTPAIVAAWGLVVSSSLLGAASTASGALMSVTCDGTAGTAANWALWPLSLLALIVMPWCLFTIISPRATGATGAVPGRVVEAGVVGVAGVAGTAGVVGTADPASVAEPASTAGAADHAGTAGVADQAGTAGTAGVAGVADQAGTAGTAGTAGVADQAEQAARR